MSYSDSMEYARHPDREEVRGAIEGLEVDPATDVIILGDEEEHRDFPKGNLRHALTSLCLDTTTIVVRRNGQEIFRKGEIHDLFGSVFF